jgi:uncharacterized membrane protein YdbT with pleckstrin-like domain
MEEAGTNKFHNSIEQPDLDETKLCEISKHPIGIIFYFTQALIGVVVALGLSYFLFPTVVTDTDTAFIYANVFALFVIVLAVGIVGLATIVYRQNRLIVTDRNITQILQYGLFNKKTSQLNLVNVEDVTSAHKGILSTIFGYGELKIETAGEQANFHFTYCPNAGYYAKVILNARENILGQNDNSPESKNPDYPN